MARGMALAGVDPSELTPPPPPKKPKTFKEKWSNYWYHYKTHTFAALFLVFLCVWFVCDKVGDNPADYQVVAVTELPLLEEEISQLSSYLAANGEDLDGDGTVEVKIESLVPSYYDLQAPTVGRADNDKLMAYLTTGEKMLFVFDRVSHDGFMKKVEDVTEEGYTFFAELPTAAADYHVDERVWSWENDSARTLFSTFGDLPDELLFGVRAPVGTASGEQSVRDHKNGEALLLKLIASAEKYATKN